MNNFAYDFEVFENNQPKKSGNVLKLPDKNQRLKARKYAKKMFWIRCMFGFFMVAMVVGSFVFGQAIVSEYVTKISVYKTNLSAIKNQNDQLEMHLISKRFCDNKSFDHSKSLATQSIEHITVSFKGQKDH